MRKIMNKYDVVIIGGGLGGLTAGALLSKKKKRVLLLEQHNIVGGCATTFNRKGFRVETGLHEMDGFGTTDLKKKIFKKLGVFNKVNFIKLSEFYRYKQGDVDITIPADYKEAQEVLTKAFPDEKEGIKKYFKRIVTLHRQINRMPSKLWKFLLVAPVFPILYWAVIASFKDTLGQFLDRIIKDEELKVILCANLHYFHDDPYTMSMIYYGAAQGGYYDNGAYYVKGGSSNLSNALADIIQENGGEVLTNSLATEILTENGKAIGVKYENKINREKFTVNCNKVISNSSIPYTIEKLLPKSERDKFCKYEKLEHAMSLISLYIGLKDRELLKKNLYSTFYFNENIKNIKDFKNGFTSDFSDRSFVFVDYGAEDPSLGDDDKNLAVICTSDYLSSYNGMNNDEYKKRKLEIEEKLIKKLESIYPGISTKIEYLELATAKTIQRFTLNPSGTAYGYAQIPSQAAILRPQVNSPVKNLYFASAWSFPGGGFTGAILSGKFCVDRMY